MESSHKRVLKLQHHPAILFNYKMDCKIKKRLLWNDPVNNDDHSAVGDVVEIEERT